MQQQATVAAVNPNVFVYPSNPSYGWTTLDPLTPRPQTKDLSVPHDDHYYGTYVRAHVTPRHPTSATTDIRGSLPRVDLTLSGHGAPTHPPTHPHTRTYTFR